LSPFSRPRYALSRPALIPFTIERPVERLSTERTAQGAAGRVEQSAAAVGEALDMHERRGL